ncbi:DNA mismatch repair protein MutT [Sporosarcina luteola]|uniref:DNA mismatch repair protein MutT n=1 Tax=Sporosarcina luteola TaxID=582850 RepID=A0A511ZCI3_9BACL|nr:NUDIX hydrolase [Sporosarcina luteola]GEN85165.1 DNA mismatch repair protein MutT [Sporosarcina luteola]
MGKWRVLNSEYTFKSPFGNLRNDTCEMPDGTVIENYYVNEYADWVNAIVLTEDEEIVLVEQYRHPGNDFYLEVPAGKVEEGETYEEAIRREIREETGYVSEQALIPLGEFMVNPATQTNNVITFLMFDAKLTHVQELDETEVLEVKHFPFAGMGEMIRNKEITQLFTVSAYHLAIDFIRNGRDED